MEYNPGIPDEAANEYPMHGYGFPVRSGETLGAYQNNIYDAKAS